MPYSPRSVVAVHSAPEWREWSVHPALARLVLGYWEQVVREGSHTIRTLPDGCVDLTCDLSRPEAPKLYIVGPQSEPTTHEVVAPTRLFGARLHPSAATHLIGARLHELTSSWQPLERFLGRPAVDLAQVVGAAAADDVPSHFDAFLSQYLLGRDRDPRLTKSLAAIFASQGHVTVAELAQFTATTQRTLRRLFETQVGLGPKRFARIVRVQAALRGVNEDTNWAALAADLGYADQSHLIREMNELFGDTPTAISSQRFAPNG